MQKNHKEISRKYMVEKYLQLEKKNWVLDWGESKRTWWLDWSSSILSIPIMIIPLKVDLYVEECFIFLLMSLIRWMRLDGPEPSQPGKWYKGMSRMIFNSNSKDMVQGFWVVMSLGFWESETLSKESLGSTIKSTDKIGSNLTPYKVYLISNVRFILSTISYWSLYTRILDLHASCFQFRFLVNLNPNPPFPLLNITI